MYRAFDAFEYIDYLRSRWGVIATACGAAFLLSLAISLLLPKHYTATATLVIEPPGGNDARLSTAVSPIYLESLKTYERFAGSDTLFSQAAAKFHLTHDGESIESVKRRVLRVSKIRDTKILEISATLKDPKIAQALAQYLAGETVNSSRGESQASDQDFIGEAQKQVDQARARLERDQKSWDQLLVSDPVEALKSEMDSSIELQGNIRQELVAAEADVAEYEQQAQGGGPFAREQLQAAQARAALLGRRLQDLDRDVQQKNSTYTSRLARREQAQSALKIAQGEFDAASKHLQEIRASMGMRVEQLRIIDAGIVPEKPSSPNVPLNVAAALFAALLASIVYLSLAFAYRRKSAGLEPAVSRSMRA